MTCDECKEQTSIWFDGELEGDSLPQILRHAGECDSCRAFMSRLPRQVRLVRTAREDLATPTTIATDRRDIFSAKGFVNSHIRTPLAAAAAIILIILTLAIERTISDRAQDRLQEWGSMPSVEQSRRLQ
jgi:predicted anti-sigma-YlaC factor YlaD